MGGLTLGAIGAALIAAVVSLIGLILGKEQKTSEFRQEWINSLRTEISVYVTNVTAISDQVKIEFENNNEKLKHLIPYYTAVSGAPEEFVWVMNEEHRRRYRYYLEQVMGLYPDDSESFGIGIMTGEPENGQPFELVRRTWEGYD